MIQKLFSKQYAENLKEQELVRAKQSLVKSLSDFLQIEFEIYNDKDDIHFTEIRSISDKNPYSLIWKGFIGSTDYRYDGQFEYGAFLFPLIGNIRACVMRTKEEEFYYDNAFRYIWLKIDGKWHDMGWQIDENYEFEHWYINEES